MKPNWKVISASKGYKSLKAEYIRNILKYASPTQRAEYKKQYFCIMGWIVSQADKQKVSAVALINYYEAERTINYSNFYGNKMLNFKRRVITQTPARYKRYLKRYGNGRTAKEKREALLRFTLSYNIKNSTKCPKRHKTPKLKTASVSG